MKNYTSKIPLLVLLIPFFLMGMTSISNPENGPSRHEQWKQFFNQDQPSLDSLYDPNAVFLKEDGEVLYGLEKINAQYDKLHQEIEAIEAVHSIHLEEAHKNIHYEIGFFLTNDYRKYHFLIIWRKEESQMVREFEYFAESNQVDLPLDEIHAARNKWVEICNEHRAADLVKELYLPNALYYHHEPPIIGTQAITEEYQYMNRPSYSIKLHPLAIVPVNQSTVLEIGHGSESFNGKYVLIWKRTESGWMILMDSNV